MRQHLSTPKHQTTKLKTQQKLIKIFETRKLAQYKRNAPGTISSAFFADPGQVVANRVFHKKLLKTIKTPPKNVRYYRRYLGGVSGAFSRGFCNNSFLVFFATF